MTNLEIVLSITLVILILGFSLYLYTRPQYEYKEAEILVIESNFGDVFKTYISESEGYVLRKIKKTVEWQILRRDWYKLFGSYYPKYKWRKLLEPHLSQVNQRLQHGEKVTLIFE